VRAARETLNLNLTLIPKLLARALVVHTGRLHTEQYLREPSMAHAPSAELASHPYNIALAFAIFPLTP
jgi:hypothetical protein